MERAPKAYQFNHDVMKSTPKKQWVKDHEHIKGIDLEAEYDKVVPPKEEKKADKKSEE